MNKTTQQAKSASFLPPAQGMLQRKCSCGNHTVSGGECSECAMKKNGLQRKLTIGLSNDPLEQEANRVADQILAAPAHSAVSGSPRHIRRFTKQGSGQANAIAPVSVDRALARHGRPLDLALRQDMEQRFGYDFSRVRVYSGDAAEQSARDVNANAYTVGHNIVFGAGQFAPGTSDGRRLLAHELVHTLQQAKASTNSTEQIRNTLNPVEPETGQVSKNVMAARSADVTMAASVQTLHRQPEHAAKDEDGEVIPAKDTFAGTMITEIIISHARKRIGFRWAMGMIMGDIDTDLKPGKYQLKPDLVQQKWIIVKPAVKAGLRFSVDLEGANPWTLKYPEILPLTVTSGSLVEPKVYGDMFDAEGNILDPLQLYEGIPPELKTKPVADIDDFESTKYDLDYRSDKGSLSKWIRVYYRDNTVKDINIDTITETTPKLWAVRKEVLIAMDNYNAMFILQTFPAVFMIITINPLGIPAAGKGAGKGVRYTANRRTFSKTNGEEVVEPPVKGGKPGSKTGEPAPKTPAPKVDEPATETGIQGGNKSVRDASSKVTPRSDGTFRLNRKNFSKPEKVIGEPESVIKEDANREAVAADLAASKPKVEKVYVGKEADKFINGSIGEETSADVVAVTKDGKYYVYEAGGSDISPKKLQQLEHTSQQLGSGSVQRQTLVMKGKLTTPGYTVENGVLMSGGKRVMVDGKPVYIKFTVQ